MELKGYFDKIFTCLSVEQKQQMKASPSACSTVQAVLKNPYRFYSDMVI